MRLLACCQSSFTTALQLLKKSNRADEMLLSQNWPGKNSRQPGRHPNQESEVTSTPTRPVDNVVITTKGLQDRNIYILAGTTVENKGKLSLF